MDKDKEIQRLQNQVNALTNTLIWLLTIMKNDLFEEHVEGILDARIASIKSLLKSPKNGS